MTCGCKHLAKRRCSTHTMSDSLQSPWSCSTLSQGLRLLDEQEQQFLRSSSDEDLVAHLKALNVF